MRKFLLPFFFLFFAPSLASATWVTGTIAELQKTPDGRVVTVVVLRDDKGNQDKLSFPGDLVAVRATILSELARRNTTEATTDIAVGTVVAIPSPPTPPTPPGPTDDELAATAFQATGIAWRVAQIKLGLQMATQSDVDEAARAVAVTYAKGTPSQIVRFDVILFGLGRGPL